MSGASSRRRGNAWELDVCRLLVARGWQAITSRNGRGGAQGGADVITDLPVSIEAKNRKEWDLAGWLDKAIRDAGDDPAAVFVKRRQKPADQCYVVMRADQWLDLAGRAFPASRDFPC
jgi:hypothetical protein